MRTCASSCRRFSGFNLHVRKIYRKKKRAAYFAECLMIHVYLLIFNQSFFFLKLLFFAFLFLSNSLFLSLSHFFFLFCRSMEQSCPKCLRKPKECSSLRKTNYRFAIQKLFRFVSTLFSYLSSCFLALFLFFILSGLYRRFIFILEGNSSVHFLAFLTLTFIFSFSLF